jgi:SNF family Na+-dependent transporter
LIAILVVDISIYQSFVQLVLGVLLLALQFIWVFKKGEFVKNMNQKNLSDLFSFVKYVFVIQTFLIMVLNIGQNEDYFL